MNTKKASLSFLFIILFSHLMFSQSSISGDVYCILGVAMEGVEVELTGGVMTPQTVYTDEDGQYAFNDLPEGVNYVVSFSKEGIPNNGLTHYDVLAIQKHYLFIELFDDPFQVLASDVNFSGGVSAYDFVVILKLILFIFTDYPGGVSVWHFGDENITLPLQDPLDDIPVFNLQSDVELNVVGYHLGDVNGSDCY